MASAPPTPTELFGWRKVVMWPVGMLARAWTRTLRLEFGPEDLRAITWREQPLAFVLWHNRLLLAGEIYRRYRGGKTLHALISASRDGAWLSAFFTLMGMQAIRGSTSRMGREAVTALVDAMRAGGDVGITPDGPRGPCYEFKPGALVVALRVRAPILLVGAAYESAWRVRSWDGFYIPRPFSKVRVRCVIVPPERLADLHEAARWVAAQLREMNPDQG